MDREQVQELIKNRAYDKGDRDFFDDLVEAFELDPTDPITTRMYSMAWDNGHSAGMHEVLAHFSDLVYVFRGNYE